ncbi:hypothetical protein [Lentzea flaviverrucosa]|uniref:Uncharacterized protein n=1 Tax=Lentzea flaviverrucosa TaxID=200379 RepID=A0A1H9UW24_9PSEU|nr:hypothetical protein [Lentzea flaviverrucosa]RDI27716.1 hypothetical protein DFR72_106201 [Lentzea flaviverrucosa]SES13267.1 hypothetical protein SAMN05216195_109144 [Lentzea flaviverrucosa]
MNEQDLKRAFQDVVVASSPPPPMDPGIALGRAHKARSKRRASITGAAVAVLVVGVGLGSAFALNPQGTTDYLVGAGQSSSSSPGLPDTQWGEQWPVGQSDRTATNGPQADRGRQLLELARASVPAGYEAPDLKYTDPAMHGGMLRAQAQVSSDKGESPEIWQYTAYVPVRKDGKVGRLTVTVTTPNPSDPVEPCALVTRFKGGAGEGCKTYDVAGKQVGVVSSTSPGQNDATWASYRAAGGWTVTVAQEEEYPYAGYPVLDRQPFFGPELAALAADPKFLLGS